MRPLPPLLFSLAAWLLAWSDTCLAAEPALQVRTRVERPPETGEITCCEVTSLLGRFTFVLPPGWRPQLDQSAGRLILHAPGFGAYVEMGFVKTNPREVSPRSTNDLIRLILARFPKAVIREHFVCYTASYAGEGFEFGWKPSREVRAVTRFAWVPCPGGILELSLTSSTGKLGPVQPVFGALLTSFRRAASEAPAKP
ncbi:MAG: hypothetical protein NTW03_10270 [Verrucomicrobia bacterium]|nr:hypothetical protein [Verrucomicrobiota bacterium]